MVSMNKKEHFAFSVWLFCIASLFSQNFVKNPSFEMFSDCPKALGNFNDDVDNWSTPTSGSTDYFHGCSESMGTPKNFNGSQPADFGKGYAGLYFYAPNDYREYLQAELRTPLIKDKTYRVSFYVSLAERSDYAVKEFGILFSKDRIEIPIKKELSKKHLYKDTTNQYTFMEVGYSNFYSDTKDWIQVYTQFTAKGTERFMTLGNFKSNARTRLFKTKKSAQHGAYYYIDMVMVAPADKTMASDVPESGKKTEDSFELDKTHIFNNLLFEFDRFRLQELSKKEIGTLYAYLSEDRGLRITISGHTDSVGSDSYNMWLSNQRAKAVVDYLLKLGLNKDRILWQGHGGSKPIATNDNEQGRQKNRRVEFVITKMKSLNK
jgi:outer membrane protein OmpA-like peptidoglycan-associated protein